MRDTPRQHVDVLIIGQGLAGTTLAWTLLECGLRVAIADRCAGTCSSRVAAGMLAPVGGKRLALAWRAREAWDAAVPFYRRVEETLGKPFLRECEVVRLFVDAAQRGEFEKRRHGELDGMIVRPTPTFDERVFHCMLGGFEASAARLDVAGYLDASRDEFIRRGVFHEADVDLARDCELNDSIAVAPGLGVAAKQVVLCRGFAEADAGQMPPGFFEPAQGEVLTLRVPDLDETRVVQRGVWLAPLGGRLFKAGATFNRELIGVLPTAAGREEIEAKLRDFLRLPFEVVGQTAGVRPIVRGRRPVVGTIQHERLGVMNGLGANGTLWAPWVARRYTDHIKSGSELPADILLSKR